MQIDSPPSLAGNGRGDHIAETHDKGPLLLRLPYGGERVGGLSRLRDRHDQIAASQDRVAVTELGGLLYLGMDTRDLLEGIFPDQTRMKRCSAPDKDHAVEIGEFAGRCSHACEYRNAVIQVQAAAEGVGQRIGLLVDLLEHEMIESPLLGG